MPNQKRSINYILLVLLIFIMLIQNNIVIAVPGDSSSDPIDIGLGKTTGTLPGPAADGSIWYNITLAAGDYHFNLTGPGGTNFDLDIYNSTLDYIGGVYGFTYPDISAIYGLEEDNYFINVYNATGTGDFTLDITELVPTPGDSPSNPIIIGLGETTGTLPGPAIDGSIWYNITLAAGDYQFNLTGPGGTNFDMGLFNSTLDLIDWAIGVTYPDIITVHNLVGDDYFINIGPTSGFGDFTLNITVLVPAPGDSPSNPIIIGLGETTGTLPGPAGDGSIWYNITLTAGDYQFNLTGPGGTDFDLALYNSTLYNIG
ncbi:MAG: hypothetical protein ACFFDC_15880, partial [Promethearchaeota archaeon]